MRDIERRLARIEEQLGEYTNRSNCSECGPTKLFMLFKEDDGRLLDHGTGLYWGVDSDNHPLCPHCGHHPVNPLLVICSMQENQPSRSPRVDG